MVSSQGEHTTTKPSLIPKHFPCRYEGCSCDSREESTGEGPTFQPRWDIIEASAAAMASCASSPSSWSWPSRCRSPCAIRTRHSSCSVCLHIEREDCKCPQYFRARSSPVLSHLGAKPDGRQREAVAGNNSCIAFCDGHMKFVHQSARSDALVRWHKSAQSCCLCDVGLWGAAQQPSWKSTLKGGR